LRDVIEKYKKEQPVIDSKRQLSGKVVDKDVRGALEQTENMSREHLCFIDAIMTLPGTTLENKMQRRITAINAVTMYCRVKEGMSYCSR
jgi:DNA gyrase/topoisomerase IV subunit B